MESLKEKKKKKKKKKKKRKKSVKEDGRIMPRTRGNSPEVEVVKVVKIPQHNREGGFIKNATYKKHEDVLEAMGDAMDLYAQIPTKENWDDVEEIGKYGVWSPILEPVDTNFIYTKDVVVEEASVKVGVEKLVAKVGKKRLKVVAYDMLL